MNGKLIRCEKILLIHAEIQMI